MAKKKIWIAVGAAGWAILFVFISWNFGWKALQRKEQRDMQLGANIIINQIINEVQQNGEVKIRQTVLIVKPKPEKKEVD